MHCCSLNCTYTFNASCTMYVRRTCTYTLFLMSLIHFRHRFDDNNGTPSRNYLTMNERTNERRSWQIPKCHFAHFNALTMTMAATAAAHLFDAFISYICAQLDIFPLMCRYVTVCTHYLDKRAEHIIYIFKCASLRAKCHSTLLNIKNSKYSRLNDECALRTRHRRV